jgi:26S proteasome regulatory subunit N5
LTETLDKMLALEKTYRLAADFVAAPRLCVAIVDVLRACEDWDGLREHVAALTKRRAQLKQAIAAMVRRCMTFIDDAPDGEQRLKLIETLCDATSGKIFVEVEKSRLTRALARMHEEAGRIDEACGVMQEVAIETYGALTRHEKLFFIEEQVRLCLAKKDYLRALILSRKINPRAFDELIDKEKKEAEKATVMAKKETELSEKEREELRAEKVKKEGQVEHAEGYFEPTDEGVPSLETLKLRYYELMVEYYSHSDEYLEQCRCYQNILECAEVKNDRERWVPTLKKIVWLVCLSKHEPMQQSILHGVKGNLKLSDLPTHEALVKQFCTKEIIHWTTLQEKYASELVSETEIFGGEDGAKRVDDLKLRVIEHNMLVIAAYYSRMSLARLSELLCLTPEETERHLSSCVVDKSVVAKIDRPAGLVDFTSTASSDRLLNKWVSNIDSLLTCLDKASHLIQKESQTYKVAL